MKTFYWWVYIILGIYACFFLAPTLISMADTLMVLLGLGLYVLFGLWSWHLWVKQLVSFIKRSDREF